MYNKTKIKKIVELITLSNTVSKDFPGLNLPLEDVIDKIYEIATCKTKNYNE